MTDDISKRLQELEELRLRLTAQIEESESVINSIETKIQELQDRQEARMNADERLTSEVVKNVTKGVFVAKTNEDVLQKAQTEISQHAEADETK